MTWSTNPLHVWFPSDERSACLNHETVLVDVVHLDTGVFELIGSV